MRHSERQLPYIGHPFFFLTAIESFYVTWCWTFHNFRIVFLDGIFHARHTTVTEFDIISIEYLIIFLETGKMIINKSHNLFSKTLVLRLAIYEGLN